MLIGKYWRIKIEKKVNKNHQTSFFSSMTDDRIRDQINLVSDAHW